METHPFDIYFSPKGTLKVLPFCCARLTNTIAFAIANTSLSVTLKKHTYTNPFLLISILMVLITVYSIYIVDSKRLTHMGRSRSFTPLGLFQVVTVLFYPKSIWLNTIAAIILFFYLGWLSHATPREHLVEDEEKLEEFESMIGLQTTTEELEKAIIRLEEALTRTDIPKKHRKLMKDTLGYLTIILERRKALDEQKDTQSQ